jgi:hypothetical protein
MNQPKPYHIIETQPAAASLFTVMIGVVIIIWLTANYLLGVFVAILGLGVAFMPRGFIIDKENNRMKKVYYFLGIPIGKWYEMPNIQYVSLLRVIQKSRRRQSPAPAFASRASNHYVYQVNLIIEEERLKALRLISTSRDHAVKEGLILGEYLDVKVLDRTTSRKEWIR